VSGTALPSVLAAPSAATSTTYVFSTSAASNFAFNATLDGALHTVTVPWNVTGQRWYVQVNDQSGDLILYMPLVSSGAGNPVNLTWGYFSASTLVYYGATGTFVVSP